ncbi:hypothetical protein [Flavihumibacter sp. CACIAM 22H1]|uniref:hypothetical protein n=1 Tax=Flavihumibacter sp. CACIAM 22H1 TaxID=1812911 RepID=UPI0007A85DE2|nr:hypothetical protein [Flavihumibacter sp. CACIAM 22H1]KYP13944.1 MAG: hypothetical protein A1D16_19690 [Flavihumibacter sp. CACIAM 22H1]
MAATVKFEDIFKTLKKQVEELARLFVKNYTKAAIQDGRKFLEETKESLKRWTILLAEGKLTTQDFEWLVLGQKDLAQMIALKQAGLSVIRIEQFRNSLLSLVVDTIFGIIL